FLVFTDYPGGADSVRNIELFRLAFMRNGLADEESRAADYLECGDLAANRQADGQLLKLHIGHMADGNECILAKMSENDRVTWASMLDGFDKVIAVSVGPDNHELGTAYAYVTDGENPAPAGSASLGTAGALPVTVKFANFRVGFRDKYGVGYAVNVYGLAVDGEAVRVQEFSVLTGYRDGTDRLENLEHFRLAFFREALADKESRAADYLDCGEMAATEPDWARAGAQQLRLHIGNRANLNICILSKMGQNDRKVWASVVDGFGDVLAAGTDTPARAELNEVHEYVTK
ncbi:MAG: hypothetical protein ACTSYE_05720, partial [Alphaproteobacteria bacterium]